jgi:antitoxin YokJ
MNINELIHRIASEADCRIFSPCGIPDISTRGLVLPPDVTTFYERCGGMELFPSARFGFGIVGPDEFVPSNPLLLGDFYLKNKIAIDADQSSAWHLIARGTTSNQFITIDLNVSKSGYCYDGFWEVYGTQNSKVLARNFTELIERLYAARGTDLYWEHNNFDLGHAYE